MLKERPKAAEFSYGVNPLQLFHGDTVVGSLRMYPLAGATNIDFISDVLIQPEFQGMGYGRALLQEALNRSRARSQQLEVVFGNARARSLYLSLGFVAVDVCHKPTGDKILSYSVMRRDSRK
jgi:ribosomal protein S18 acetylase RimI-like enzyme